jgi:hypothetical protein
VTGNPPTGSVRSVRGIRGAARQPSARSKATDSATVTITVTPVEDGPRWYPHIPWAPVSMGNGNDYEWYNFELWDGVPDALGAHKVLETNVHGLAMTTAEEYFMAGSDGLLPGTYQWRYRTWVPETDIYGTAWRPGSGGQTLTIEYGLPALPTGLTCEPNPGASGNLTLSFVAGNAQGYDLEISGTLPQNNQVLHGAYFMPGADRVVPYDWVTSRAVTLAGPDTCTWRIRGFNPSGTSAWSRGPDITVGGGPRDPMPEVPDYRTMRPVDAWVVTALEGTSSIAFQWNSVPGAAGYLVYLSSASGVPILNYIDVGNVTRVDSIEGTRIALPPGNYVWCLLAYNAAQPREYGGWNHSSRTPTQESPIFFQVIADLRAPTITSAFRDEAANTVRIGWVGTAPATVDLLLFYSAAARWLDIRNQPVTATGESTGIVTLGQHAWGPGANYLLLTGKTATGTAGPRSRLFLLP